MTARVYKTLMERARLVLEAGHTVIVDAVFARPSDRVRVANVAGAAGRPFTGLWLAAEPSDLRRRVETRGPDASDADASVLDQQLKASTGPIDWHVIDARQQPPVVLHQAREHAERRAVAPGSATP